MSKAKQIVEALTGPELAILQKYHIADETGAIRQVDLIDPSDQVQMLRRMPLTPIIAPKALNRLLALDQTADKHILDWIFYTAGGGARAFTASQEAVNLARECMTNNRTGEPNVGTIDTAYENNPEAFEAFSKEQGYASFHEMKQRGGKFGIGPDNEPIKPMTAEQAEAEWAQDEPVFRAAYFYADEDIAKDQTKPFGYFQNFPGRDSVYEKLEEAVNGYNSLVQNANALKLYNKWTKAKGEPRGFNFRFMEADGTTELDSPQALSQAVKQKLEVVDAVDRFQKLITVDKKKLSAYNRLMPAEPFKTSLADYESPQDLIKKVGTFTRNFAKQLALSNVQFHGKAKAPATGYTKGPNEVIYDDEFMTVVIPASAGAALKKGWNDWCISNRSNFDSYFQSGDEDRFYWAHPRYTRSSKLGVFGFWTFKIAVEERNQQLAGFFRLGNRTPGSLTIVSIEWTDKVNSPREAEQCNIKKVESEIAAIDPRALESFRRSIEEVKAWVMQHKPGEDIEQLPSLESLARQLVAMMLGEVLDTGERPQE